MPPLSPAHAAKLNTCHPELIRLVRKVAERWPLAVVEGHRGQEAQDAAFRAGRSRVRWPNGKHNASPALAVDLAPMAGRAIPWPDQAEDPVDRRRRELLWLLFCGYVLGVAAALAIPLRWGGDWDGDLDLWDQKLVDWPHFELTFDPAEEEA